MNSSFTNKAFLSHSKKEKPFVEELAKYLRSNGVDVFFDKWDILGGDSIPGELEEGLSNCNLFLYVLSPSSVESKWATGEYHAFLYRKMNENALRIIPILRETCAIPLFIAPLKYVNFRDFDHLNTSNFSLEINGPFKELLETIFRLKNKSSLGSIHPALASYEFYFQPIKDQKNADGTLNYEIGFKNLTDLPLHNFTFTIIFDEPVISVDYDFQRSSANMTGGNGLTDGGKRFNWLGNQIMEDGGWAVFTLKTKNMPVIKRLSTKLVGRAVGSNKVISPDPSGI